MCKHSLHVFVLFSHRPAVDHFVECHICYSLKQSMYNYLNGVSAALVAKEAFAIHVKDFSNDITQLLISCNSCRRCGQLPYWYFWQPHV